MNKSIILFYIVPVFLLVLLSYAFIDQNLFYLHQLYTSFAYTERLTVSSVYFTVLILLFINYARLIIGIHNKTFIPKINSRIIISSFVLLTLAYPAMLSYDIFNYMATAKVTYFYHENPYLMMPIEFSNEPLLKFTHAANKTALYGPVWIILTAIPYILGLGNFIFTLYLFKVLTAVFYIFTLYLIYKIANNRSSVLIFAFNPLVMIETFVSGHNDIVMMGLALYALWWLKNKKVWRAFLFLLLSIGIKFATVFLIPLFIYTSILILLKKKLNWEKIYFAGLFSMAIIFLLAPLREEIYPWYAIWFLPFVALVPFNRKLFTVISLICLGLLFRYLPFMYLGIYRSPALELKIIFTVLPLIIYFVVSYLKKLFIFSATDGLK